MSERGQIIMVWWAVVFMVAYGICLWIGFEMLPPPKPLLTAEEVAAFYAANNGAKRMAAVVSAWASAFMVPLATVVAIQLARIEKGKPVWSILCFAGGIMMSVFLVLPPLFFGAAAFTPSRMPEVTALMHELGVLTLVTTDQYYIFQMIAIVIVSLSVKDHDALSAFPRGMGYFTAWAAIAFETGALAFIPKTGPFAWNGLVSFWMPLCLFAAWLAVLLFMLLRALHRQAAANTA